MTDQPTQPQELTDQGPSRGDRVRQTAVSAVLALYRLLKASLLHNTNNATVVALIQNTTDAVRDYCSLTGASRVRMLFASSTVFVNGALLRASQSSYESAIDLGTMLDKCGVSEVTLPESVTPSDMAELARRFSEALRGSGSSLESWAGAITLRKVALASFDAPSRPQSTRERVLRTYSAAVVVMRTFYADLGKGNDQLPNRIRRVAQKLVSHAEESVHTLTGMLGARPHESDAGALAVNTAILALAMARQVTPDRHVLVGIVTTALLYDTARVRVLRAGSGGERALSEAELDRLPASSTVMLTSLGRLHVPSLQRAVVAYEAHWLARSHRLGPPYASLHAPLLASRIVATARAFTEIVASGPGRPDLPIDDAIQVLLERARTPNDRIDVKLLTSALGIFPVGTLVELDTGEMAVVTGPPTLPGFFARPPVRLLYDKDMLVVDPPLDVDLAAAGGQPLRRIRRVIDTDDQQMKRMRSFLVAAQARVAREPKRPAPPQPAPVPEPSARRAAPPLDPEHDVKTVVRPPKKEAEVPHAPAARPTPTEPQAADPTVLRKSLVHAEPPRGKKIDNLLAEFLAEDVPPSSKDGSSRRSEKVVDDEPPASSRRDPRSD